MALSNAGNGQLAPRTIAELAWVRLYDSFPMRYVTRASGPRGMIWPHATTDNTGTIAGVNEAAAQASENTYQATMAIRESDLVTYRAAVTVSNELLADSGALSFIASRLSGQIIEKVGSTIVSGIASRLIATSRTSDYPVWHAGTVGTSGAGISINNAFLCLSNLNNEYRRRSCWVFSPNGFLNWGTQEGKNNLSTIPFPETSLTYRRLSDSAGSGGTMGSASSGAGIGVSIGSILTTGASGPVPVSSGGGFGGIASTKSGNIGDQNGGGGWGELEAMSSDRTLTKRERMSAATPVGHADWQTSYLGRPVYTSDGLSVTDNGAGEAWAMLVDLTAWIHFDQPLTVTLDTESLIAKNETVVHAAYRAAGAFMEPMAGWALIAT